MFDEIVICINREKKVFHNPTEHFFHNFTTTKI